MSKKVVIAGGGVLGTQIGLICAYHGFDTTFWLRSEDSIGRTQPKLDRYKSRMLEDLEKSKALINNPLGARLYPRALITKWEGITEEKIDELINIGKVNMDSNIHIELDIKKAVENADIIIESMSEDPKAKIQVYEAMKDFLSERTILCTNSSTMLPSTFAEYTGRPERYCALHFANTIWRNNTAEVMGHPGTDPEVYNQVVAFASEIGMIPLQLHKEQPGYILNSMLVPFLDSALMLWTKDVADPETIDKIWKLATGAPRGPFEIMDVVGLDTLLNINQMKPESKNDGTIENLIGKRLKEKIDKGERGINTGIGFYKY